MDTTHILFSVIIFFQIITFIKININKNKFKASSIKKPRIGIIEASCYSLSDPSKKWNAIFTLEEIYHRSDNPNVIKFNVISCDRGVGYNPNNTEAEHIKWFIDNKTNNGWLDIAKEKSFSWIEDRNKAEIRDEKINKLLK